MSIEIHTMTINGRYEAVLPDASAIPVQAVAKAATEAKAAEAELSAQRRECEAANRDVQAARDLIAAQAAELKIKKKKLGKEILEPLREAEAVAELAQVSVEASMRAFEHSFAALQAEVNANRKAWEEAAIKDAHAALQRLGAAKVAFASAAVAAHSSYEVLGMFSENDRTGENKLKMRDRFRSNRRNFTEMALLELDKAVSRNALELEAFKRGDAPTPKELRDYED